MKNLDLFGNEVDVPDLPKGRRKTPTMQEMFGLTPGHECRDCAHHFTNTRGKTYHKCEIWQHYFPGGGHSEASDIRCKDPACGKWVSEEDFPY